MCGIAAVFGRNNVESKSMILNMLDVQKHRGPDSQGYFIDGPNALGHNRLSIISLSKDSDQPMRSSCGRFQLIFNGEIYNYIELRNKLKPYYHFKTNSDSEVLLAAYIVWGESMLNKLCGIFSFIIYDCVTKDVFGARDRFGVKPLYYTSHKGITLFSSEIKTIWSATKFRTPNLNVWYSYYSSGSYGEPHETFWEGIFQIPGGNSFSFNVKNGLNVKKWYDFINNVNSIEVNMKDNEIKNQWIQLAKNSIELRFRSDVPVGFNISGGLDSSLLLSLVYDNKGSEAPINAYTFYSNFDKYDEIRWVKQLISKINYPLKPILFDLETIPELAQKIALNQDEPFGGLPTIAYSNIFYTARQEGVIVLLDGQGIDESLAGYDYYYQNSNSIIQGVKESPFKINVLKDDFKDSYQIKKEKKQFF